MRKPTTAGLVGLYATALILAWLRHKPKCDKRTGPAGSANESKHEQHWPNSVGVHIKNEGWPADDSRHQRNEAKYWIASIVISVIGTAAAMIAAIFAGGAFEASRNQVGIARASLEGSQRPWILITGINADGPLEIQNGVLALPLEVSVANYASYPAVGSFVSAHLMTTHRGFNDPIGAGKNFCKDNKPVGYVFGDAVPPTLPIVEKSVAVMSEKEIMPATFIGSKPGMFHLIVYGCVYYFGLDGKGHITGFVNDVDDTDQGLFKMPFQTTAKARIKIDTKRMLGGYFAD